MAFHPSIVVTGPDALDIALVVAATTNLQGLEDSERQLKNFMLGMRTPIGLLVTPQTLWLYRDRYVSASEDSIARIGEFDVRDALRFPNGGALRGEDAFEERVQSWLEGLSSETGLRELSPALRAAAQQYIVPAISTGSIRAGHPRPSLTA